ncbi:MAG: hypothetical protein R3E21_07450 [Caenibius sp.]
MKTFSVALATSFAVIACSPTPTHEPESINGLELTAARTDASRYLGPKSRIVAICGPSKGVGLYLDSYADGYSPDQIENGVIIFGFDADDNPEIVHRDALKEMVVMSEEGAQISFNPDPRDNRMGIWIVQFPDSRIVETHNLTLGPNDQPLDLWTSNKPSLMIKARSFAFNSKCEFQS